MNPQVRYYGDKISKRIAKTPEGFLICQDVPISRTGYQEYLASELYDNPINKHKIIPVYRPASEVFDMRSLASFEGKPVTNEHPDEDVTPENYQRYSCGHVQNVHVGEGEDSNKVLADLYITDPTLIRLITEGKREISCGYYAEEKKDSSGHLFQTKIRGNHVAVVKNGRAGNKVCIRDKKPDYWRNNMRKRSYLRYFDDDPILEDDDLVVEDDELMEDEDEILEDDDELMADDDELVIEDDDDLDVVEDDDEELMADDDFENDDELLEDDEELLDEDEVIEDDDYIGDEDEILEDDDELVVEDDDEILEDDDLDVIEDDDELLEDDMVLGKSPDDPLARKADSILNGCARLLRKADRQLRRTHRRNRRDAIILNDDDFEDDEELLDELVVEDEDEILEDDDLDVIEDEDELALEDDDEALMEDDDEILEDEDELEEDDPIVDADEIMEDACGHEDDDELMEDDDEFVEDDDVEVTDTEDLIAARDEGEAIDSEKTAALREITEASRGITDPNERKQLQDAIYKALCGKKSQMADVMRITKKNRNARNDSAFGEKKGKVDLVQQQSIYDSFNPHKKTSF